MEIIEKIHNFLDYKIKKPAMYGEFHLLSLAAIVFLTTLICIFFKNVSENGERWLVLITWIVIALFELYKQFNFSISFEDGKIIWDYRWGSFPFQFCSSPLYVLPFVAFLPNGRLREAFISFLCTYSLFAGLAVCIYPGTAYGETLGLCIQTMVWHGSQVMIGIYFCIRRFSSKSAPGKKNFFLKGIPIFLVFVAIATVLNVVVHGILTFKEIDESFDMFFISPYYETVIPILKTIQKHAPFPIFLLSYVLGFTFISYIIFMITVYFIEKNGKEATGHGNGTKSA